MFSKTLIAAVALASLAGATSAFANDRSTSANDQSASSSDHLGKSAYSNPLLPVAAGPASFVALSSDVIYPPVEPQVSHNDHNTATYGVDHRH